METNRVSITAWNNEMVNKWRKKRKTRGARSRCWQEEWKDEGESERRQEMLTPGGVNH